MDKGAEHGLLRYLLCTVGYVQKQNEGKGRLFLWHKGSMLPMEKQEKFQRSVQSNSGR